MTRMVDAPAKSVADNQARFVAFVRPGDADPLNRFISCADITLGIWALEHRLVAHGRGIHINNIEVPQWVHASWAAGEPACAVLDWLIENRSGQLPWLADLVREATCATA